MSAMGVPRSLAWVLIAAALLALCPAAWGNPFAPDIEPIFAGPATPPGREAVRLRLAGLFLAPTRRLVLLQGENDRWWLLHVGDSLPASRWRFVGVALGRALFADEGGKGQTLLEVQVGESLALPAAPKPELGPEPELPSSGEQP